jgi:hypothetical protein
MTPVAAAWRSPVNDDVLAIGKWTTNGDMIADVARLGYLPEPVLDTTFAKGVFWKRHRPASLVTNDLDSQYPTDHHFDVRDIPFPDASFPCVVFDPPYKLNGTSTGRGASAADARYGVTEYASTAARHGLLFDGMNECARVLTPGGYLLVKVQDSVSGGRVRWQTMEAALHGEGLGLRLVDSFLYMGRRKQPEGRGQVHARRNYSTLLVFRKPTPRRTR